jgi:cation diffusion facilitator CzcD-associated flavoprotein CzcO
MNKISSEAVEKVKQAIYAADPYLWDDNGVSKVIEYENIRFHSEHLQLNTETRSMRESEAAIQALILSGEVVLRADVEKLVAAANGMFKPDDQTSYKKLAVALAPFKTGGSDVDR